MTEAEGRSHAVRHSEEDREDDNGQENVARLTDEGPYAIIWHAQYHEWYGTEDPSTGEGRYKPKGDAGAVLAKKYSVLSTSTRTFNKSKNRKSCTGTR